MGRPRFTALALLLALIVPLVGLVACSSSPEGQLVLKYFQASRMRDNTTLQNIATVSFSPTEEGILTNPKVVSEGQEQRRALELKQLKAAEDAARQADEEFNKKKKEYQDANIEAIDRVLKAEREGKALRGKDLEVQQAWAKWREDTKTYAEKLTEARRALSAERALVEVSVYDARNPVDAAQFDGDLVTKDIMVGGKLKKGDAPAVDTRLHVKLTRAELRNGPNGASMNGRWVITHVSAADDGQTPAGVQ